jgi:hypothetical protein
LKTCGVDGCEFQTKDTGTLKKHHASVHEIGDMEKAARRKEYVRAQRVFASAASAKKSPAGKRGDAS